MQYLKNPHTNFFDKYGVLKYSNYLPEKDLPIIETIQNENLFIKKKITEIENRLNRHSAHHQYYSDRKNYKSRLSYTPTETTQTKSLSLMPIEGPKTASDKKHKSKMAKSRMSLCDENESAYSRKTGNYVTFKVIFFLSMFYLEHVDLLIKTIKFIFIYTLNFQKLYITLANYNDRIFNRYIKIDCIIFHG